MTSRLHRKTRGLVLVLVLALASLSTPAVAQQDIAAIEKRYQELYAAGNYAAALVEAQKYEAAVKARTRESNPTYAAALHKLALVHWRQGKFGEAEALYRRALAIREQAVGANHPNVADTLNDLGLVYKDQRKQGEAEGAYKRALAIYERASGANPLHVANTLANLANLYKDQGKYDE